MQCWFYVGPTLNRNRVNIATNELQGLQVVTMFKLNCYHHREKGSSKHFMSFVWLELAAGR